MTEKEEKAFRDDILRRVRERLAETGGIRDVAAKEIIMNQVFDDQRSEGMDFQDLNRIINNIFYKTRKRLGILQPLLEDESVTEIMVNGPENIFVEQNGKIRRYEMKFDSAEELEEIIRNIAGDVHREINEMNPIVDARLPNGSRVNGVYKNVAVNGPILTVRKFSDRYMSMRDLVANGTLDEECAGLLKVLVETGYNVFVSGGTSSGKTTLLNALAEFIPKDERVIVIEDSMELKFSQVENIVHMESRESNSSGKGRVTMSGLIKSSLRMRPDRIIVGEVRGEEVVQMLQAMNTGHRGSLSTGHGNSVEGMLKRLETMYLSALPISVDAIRSQIAEGINIMVHITRDRFGRRRVEEITELVGYFDGEYRLNRLYFAGQRTGAKLVKCDLLYEGRGENLDRLRKRGFISERKTEIYGPGFGSRYADGDTVL